VRKGGLWLGKVDWGGGGEAGKESDANKRKYRRARIRLLLYEGRLINKLQNRVFWLIFKVSKNLKHTYCRKFISLFTHKFL